MNLLSGLEKFGLDVSEDMDIFEEDKPKTGTGTEAVEENRISNRGYVLIKKRESVVRSVIKCLRQR